MKTNNLMSHSKSWSGGWISVGKLHLMELWLNILILFEEKNDCAKKSRSPEKLIVPLQASRYLLLQSLDPNPIEHLWKDYNQQIRKRDKKQGRVTLMDEWV